jgi:hypothetical protein
LAYDEMATQTPDVKTGISKYQGHTITRTPDGQITVDTGEPIKARIPRRGDFDENLAELMDQSERRLLAMRLKEFCKADMDSRADWEAREKLSMAMLGLKKQSPQDTDDEDLGGHDTTHPMLMEATTRFQSNAIVELFPPEGPAETKVLGQQTAPKMARAKRIRTFVNHYLTDLDDGYFNDTDKMTMYLPMGGSAFRRASQDFTTGLPILRHVKGTQFIAPYAGTDLPSMPRYAWDFTMTGEDIDKAMQIGMFIDLYLQQPAVGEAEHALAMDISDQRSPSLHDRDRLYKMLEYHVDLQLECDKLGDGAKVLAEGDVGRRPYLVVMDASNDEVLMCRRNWRKKDTTKFKKRIWFAHHQFLPGLGFYGWGYPHVIGSLGMAASGAVNSLLDSALASNFQGGFVSKEAKLTGEFRLEFGVWKQVDSSGEDLAKSFFTPPFKEPSPALFQLLGSLVEAGQRFCGTTDAAVGDGNNTGPVGTTIALIDQAQKPINAIHKRLHVSMSQELQMLCELMEDFMPERYDYNIGDEAQFLLKTDFAPGVDVLCVTDPAVSSDTQRVMRAQAVLELQEKAPDLYPPEHRAEAHKRMLIALKVPNLDAIGPVSKTPPYLDAVGENANIFAGVPVKVYPTQDDKAHLAIHQDGLQRASSLYPPDVFEKVIQPAMAAHIRDHMAKAYYKQIMVASGLQVNFDADGNPQTEDPQQEAQISNHVAQMIAQLPHPPPKPGTPSAEAQAKQAESQVKIQLMQAEASATADAAEQKFQAEQRRLQEAFDNEEKRKDQALNNQEARVDTLAATKNLREGVAQHQKLRHAEAGHVQDLVQGEQEHEQGLTHAVDEHGQKIDQQGQAHEQQIDHGQESHEQQLDHGEQDHTQDLKQGKEAHKQTLKQGDEAHGQQIEHGAEDHEASLEQGEQAHKQALLQAQQDAKAAASEESEADSHQGGSVK